MNLQDVFWKCVRMDKNVSDHPESQQNGAQNSPKSGNFLKILMPWFIRLHAGDEHTFCLIKLSRSGRICNFQMNCNKREPPGRNSFLWITNWLSISNLYNFHLHRVRKWIENELKNKESEQLLPASLPFGCDWKHALITKKNHSCEHRTTIDDWIKIYLETGFIHILEGDSVLNCFN